MTRVAFYATLPHFAAHLLPIWQTLPEDIRGPFCARGRAYRYAKDKDVEVFEGVPRREPLVCVASFEDYRSCANAEVILVNHGVGQTYCVSPSTRILSEDLRWLRADEVVEGQQLVGFEEQRRKRDGGLAKSRQWQSSTVLSTQIVTKPCYRLYLEDGTELVSSADHLWLKREKETFEWLRTEKIASLAGSQKSSHLVKTFDVWNEDFSWGAGYLSAAFDGEGCLSQNQRKGRQAHCSLSFTQKDNAMLQQVEQELRLRGFSYTRGKEKNVGVMTLYVTGGTKETLRFLGSIRPRRLLDKFIPLNGGQMRGKPVRVIGSEFLGEQETIALTTSSRTFFAEGFASHNCGDSKGANNPSYSGGRNRERVVLFIEPSQRAADATLAAQPDARIVVAGCSKMDPWHLRRGWRPEGEPVVAVTFHADVHVVPETRWAFPYYRDVLRDIARSGKVRLLGHGHPRNAHYLHRTFWKFLDIPFTYDFDEVLEQATCLVVDNSSVLYEFASTDRPVVILSAPWYRRDVHHGLRFWSAIPGVHVEEPDQLLDGIHQALADPPEFVQARHDAVQEAYEGLDDGQATCRARDAIVDLLNG